MLFNLLLVNIIIVLCFFYFLFFFCFFFFTIPVEIENASPNLALTTPTGAPMTAANDAIEMLPRVMDKTINDFSR